MGSGGLASEDLAIQRPPFPRGTAGLRAQRHRKTLRVASAPRRIPARGPHLRRQYGRLRMGLRTGGGIDRRRQRAAARRMGSRACARAGTTRESSRRLGLSRQRLRLRLRPRAILAPQGRRVAHEHAAFGHRLMMDHVVPGGVGPTRRRASPRCATSAPRSRAKSSSLHDIYDEHAGLQDRVPHCGIVTPALAAKLGFPVSRDARAARAATCGATSRSRPTTCLR